MSHRRAKRIRAYIRELLRLDQARVKDGLPSEWGNLTAQTLRKMYRKMKRAARDQKGLQQ